MSDAPSATLTSVVPLCSKSESGRRLVPNGWPNRILLRCITCHHKTLQFRQPVFELLKHFQTVRTCKFHIQQKPITTTFKLP